MNTPLRVLMVEDSEFDVLLLMNLLRKGGYDPYYQRVDTPEKMRKALREQAWDLVISDYRMPTFSMTEALDIVHESGLDLPFLIVSGEIGEEIAVAAMRAGAHDYLIKSNLTRLVPAITRELKQASNRTARHQAERALRESELRYRLLWETCTDAVVLMDMNCRIQYANPAIVQVFGYTQDEVAGKNLADLLAEDAKSKFRERIQQFLEQPKALAKNRLLETSGKHQDGRSFDIEIVFNELQLHSQRWLVAFIRDVAERKKAEQELRQNQEQFQLAREIQQRLFPKTPPQIPGFDIAGASFPAEATGGDYFDYLPLPDGCTALLVGDVTGHGVGPAMLMAETRAYLKILSKSSSHLDDILTRANQVLADDVSFERFVTLLIVKLNDHSRQLCYANAGHPPGVILDQQGRLKRQLKRTGIPLGINPETVYQSTCFIDLAPNDLILLLTDGIEEAISPQEEFFGSERLLSVVRKHLHSPAQKIVHHIYDEVRRFAQGTQQLDDVTIIAIKVLPRSSPDTPPKKSDEKS